MYVPIIHFVTVDMQLHHNKCYFLVTTLKDNVTATAFQKFKTRPKVTKFDEMEIIMLL